MLETMKLMKIELRKELERTKQTQIIMKVWKEIQKMK